MYSVKEYCEKLSSPELNGALSSYCHAVIDLPESIVELILDTLKKRGELDPEIAVMVEATLRDRKPDSKECVSENGAPLKTAARQNDYCFVRFRL